MVRLIIVTLLVLVRFTSSAQQQEVAYSLDTVEFHLDNNKKPVSETEYTKILHSSDKRAIAELFNKTGVYFANNGEHKRSIGYFTIAIHMFLKNGNSKEACVATNYLATVYYNLFRYEKAISLYQQSIKVQKKRNDYRFIGQTYTEIAFVYFNTFRYGPAKYNFGRAIVNQNKGEDTIGLSQTYYFLGNVYLEEENYDSTLYYYNLSLEKDSLLKNRGEIAASLNNLSVVHYRKGNYKVAASKLREAIAYNNAINNPKANAIFKNNLGNISYDSGDIDSAIVLYLESMEQKKAIGYSEGIAITEYNIGNAYRKKGDVKKSFSYFISAIERATKYENKLVAARCYKALSEMKEKEAKHQEAFEYYEKFIVSSYSLLLEEDNLQESEFTSKYEKSRQEAQMLGHEIQMRQLFSDYDSFIKGKEINALKEKKKTQMNLIYAFMGFLLFLIAVAILVYNRYRIKRQASLDMAVKNEDIEKQNAIIQKQSDELSKSNKELEKLSIVASETDNAVIIMDGDGNFQWVNEGYTKLFGLTLDGLKTTVSENIISERTPEYIREKYEHCKKTLETVSYELQSKDGKGNPIWVSVTLTPILDENGKLSKLVSIDADITKIKNVEKAIIEQKNEIEKQRDLLKGQTEEILQQKQELELKRQELDKTLTELQSTQKKLVESEKMAALGNLVAGVAHEINTPVGIGIAASSSMATRTEAMEESFNSKKMTMSDLQNYLAATKQSCELILSNLNKTAELVKSFKQVSIDNMTEQKRTFNFLEYLNDIVRSMGPKIRVRKVDVVIDCPPDIELNSYPSAYYQIINNFLNNSLLHAFEEEDNGSMTIKAFIKDGIFHIIYSDNGKGIPPQNVSRIFEPFFTTHMQQGSGLGMHIVYNIITQKLGGEISLESKLGEGVRFTITIPTKNII